MAALVDTIVAEQDVPRTPIAVPAPPAMPRPAAIEIVEPPPPQPTNGHTHPHEATIESPPRVASLPKVEKRRTHVKFDCTHGPRGPFATARWHDRVTYEISGDAESEEFLDPDDDWTDVDADN